MSTVTRALDELAEARERNLLSEAEVAHRARLILDHDDMKVLDVVEFLQSKGYEGARLFRAAGDFGRALALAYLATRGKRPLKAEQFLPHLNQQRSVCVYLESDRELVERVFAGWAK